ncbi:hypothetical protein C2E23DRAFT_813431 [Lenzites betulinus]|nr:hypothetical protein C2E23DRAFT_813431 [Lenzites betulinus]
MVWASRRETTRVEDEAYSLLGIFGVYMPIIYGEGRNAFIRLQEEILNRTSDQSVFAWGPFATLQLTTVPYARNPAPPVFRSASPDTFRNLLAPSPTFFADCADIRPLLPTEHRGLRNHKCVTKWVSALTNEYPATPRGLRTRFPILPLPHFFVGPSIILALLPFQDANERILSLVVKRIGWSTDRKVYRITNDLDDFPDLYSRTCQLSFSVRCPEGCGPSRIRIVALDPAVFELAIRNTLVFMQPTELYIQVTGPMRPQIPIQDTQSLSRDKNSVNTIIFPPWLKQHAQNSRFDVSAYKYVHPTSGEEPGVGVQDMEKAVVLAVPAPSFAGDLLIVHFRGIHDDLSADEPNPWDVTLVVAQALGPRPFARMSTKLPGVFSVAALKSPSASQHAPDALWPCLRPAVGGKPPLPPHVEQLPAWDEDSYRHLYPLDDIEPGLCLTVTFWESPGHGTATGKGGSGRAERCYTMDVVFEHHLPLSRPTTDPPLMSESRSQADSAELDDRRQMDSSPAPRECGWMQMCLSAFRINKNREHNRR